MSYHPKVHHTQYTTQQNPTTLHYTILNPARPQRIAPNRPHPTALYDAQTASYPGIGSGCLAVRTCGSWAAIDVNIKFTSVQALYNLKNTPEGSVLFRDLASSQHFTVFAPINSAVNHKVSRVCRSIALQYSCWYLTLNCCNWLSS